MNINGHNPIVSQGTFPFVKDIISPTGHLLPIDIVNPSSTVVTLSPQAMAMLNQVIL